MRPGVEGMGEGAYCLTQLASALEFASHADASVLADITEEELNEVSGRVAIRLDAILRGCAPQRQHQVTRFRAQFDSGALCTKTNTQHGCARSDWTT